MSFIKIVKNEYRIFKSIIIDYESKTSQSKSIGSFNVLLNDLIGFVFN